MSSLGVKSQEGIEIGRMWASRHFRRTFKCSAILFLTHNLFALLLTAYGKRGKINKMKHYLIPGGNK